MTEKLVPQLDQHGYFVGPVVADPSPLEQDVYLIPAGAIDAEVPTVPPGKRAHWNGAGFDIEDVPQPAPDPEPTPDELKGRAWDRIQARRTAVKSGGVKVGASWFHTDTESRIQHLGLKDQARDLLAAGQPDTTRLQKLDQDVRWKTMDGSFVYLTVKHAFDIVAAVGDLDAMAHAAAEQHRAAMEASADPAAYDFSGDWPETYAEYASRTAAT